MKLLIGIRMLSLLTTREEDALTTSQIAQRWLRQGGGKVALRSIQRYISELSQDSEDAKALVAVVQKGRERTYYLKSTEVANWFMTEDAAVVLRLSSNVSGRVFGAGTRSNGQKLVDMAERVVAASPEAQRICDRLRVAPDGIGRLLAAYKPQVLQAAIDAIAQDRQFLFTYTGAAGRVSRQVVSPLGLVAKDGTMYLVGTEGLQDPPRHFPLHRMSDVEVHFRPAQARPGFELDRYIADSHGFSHVLRDKPSPVRLVLRVAPETIYHFRERPLAANQQETAPTDQEPWHTVAATVPWTILLVPFLVSMGPWIEVLEPSEVRTETADWIGRMAAHYTDSRTATATDAVSR